MSEVGLDETAVLPPDDPNEITMVLEDEVEEVELTEEVGFVPMSEVEKKFLFYSALRGYNRGNGPRPWDKE